MNSRSWKSCRNFKQYRDVGPNYLPLQGSVAIAPGQHAKKTGKQFYVGPVLYFVFLALQSTVQDDDDLVFPVV